MFGRELSVYDLAIGYVFKIIFIFPDKYTN